MKFFTESIERSAHEKNVRFAGGRRLISRLKIIGGFRSTTSSFWTGSGTNRAAMVVEWSEPESFLYSTVPAPIADKTFVWGYRFNGTATASQMVAAIAAADPKLYVVADDIYGTFVEAIGYNLNGDGGIGITDETSTNYFTNAILTEATVDVDAAAPFEPRRFFWSGLYGPNWNCGMNSATTAVFRTRRTPPESVLDAGRPGKSLQRRSRPVGIRAGGTG